MGRNPGLGRLADGTGQIGGNHQGRLYRDGNFFSMRVSGLHVLNSGCLATRKESKLIGKQVPFTTGILSKNITGDEEGTSVFCPHAVSSGLVILNVHKILSAAIITGLS